MLFYFSRSSYFVAVVLIFRCLVLACICARCITLYTAYLWLFTIAASVSDLWTFCCTRYLMLWKQTITLVAEPRVLYGASRAVFWGIQYGLCDAPSLRCCILSRQGSYALPLIYLGPVADLNAGKHREDANFSLSPKKVCDRGKTSAGLSGGGMRFKCFWLERVACRKPFICPSMFFVGVYSAVIQACIRTFCSQNWGILFRWFLLRRDWFWNAVRTSFRPLM